MKSKYKPYRHEIKSKLKTQVVKDKTKYNRIDFKEVTKEEFEQNRIESYKPLIK